MVDDYTSCAEDRPVTKGDLPARPDLAADAPTTTPTRDDLNTRSLVAGPGRELEPPSATWGDLPPEEFIRQWALRLRDLCDDGALSARVRFAGSSHDVTLTYTAGEGAQLVTAGRTLTIPDKALERHAYGLAEASPSSSKERQIGEGPTIESES